MREMAEQAAVAAAVAPSRLWDAFFWMEPTRTTSNTVRKLLLYFNYCRKSFLSYINMRVDRHFKGPKYFGTILKMSLISPKPLETSLRTAFQVSACISILS